jgi:ribosomal protein S5
MMPRVDFCCTSRKRAIIDLAGIKDPSAKSQGNKTKNMDPGAKKLKNVRNVNLVSRAPGAEPRSWT